MSNLLFTMTAPLVLASASPRRRRLLEDAGLVFEVRLPGDGFEEPSPAPGDDPGGYVLTAAAAKAAAVAALRPDAVVVGADTIVTVGGAILGKPGSHDEAYRMLSMLNGGSHEVMTAVSIVLPGRSEGFVDSARVDFHRWDDGVVRAYADGDEPMDKAGAYAIQGQGAFLVKGIEGSWTTVVGLPVQRLLSRLLELGVIRV